ncbi:hypothetical protein GF336_05635 [Candidatus Woesearchaeota archaeon]|nr:hypothetical protein [Candidatus Woesearchaeota archaeon]
MAAITLEQIHEDLIGLRKEMKDLKALIKDESIVSEDVLSEIEDSRKKSKSRLISHDVMRDEFA